MLVSLSHLIQFKFRSGMNEMDDFQVEILRTFYDNKWNKETTGNYYQR